MELVVAGDHGAAAIDGVQAVPEPVPAIRFRPDTGRAIVATLVGAGLALLPAVLGVAALRRLPDPSASRVVAGAGVLLAGVAVVLRLAVAARLALVDDVQFVQF